VQTQIAEPGGTPSSKQEFAGGDKHVSSIKHEAEETSTLRTVLPGPDEKATQPRIVAETAASDYVPSILPISSVADDVVTQQGLDEDLFSSTNGVVAPVSGGLLAQVFGDDFDAPDVDDLDDVLDWPSDPDADVAAQVTKTGTRRAQLSRSARESWLYNACIPRLRRSLSKRGFISIHQLAEAQNNLGHDERLCTVLLRELDHDDVRVTRSVAHTRIHGTSISEVENLFAPLLRRPPYPHDVLRYMQMDHLQLSPDVIDFAISAFEMHCLTLNTEQVLIQRLLAAREPGCPETARVNDPEAWHALFNDSLYIVCRIASHQVGKGLDIEDLIQEGCLGLMTGLDRYKPDKAARLMHYLPSWIFQRISRATSDTGSVIRLPVHIRDQANQARPLIQSYIDELGEAPTAKWSAQILGLPEQTTARILGCMQGVLSLDSLQLDVLVQNQSIIDDLMQPERDIYEIASHADLRREIDRLLARYLSDRERLVIERRFRFHDDIERPLDAIGRELGITRERVRQIEAQALDKMRRSKSQELRDWLPAKVKPAASRGTKTAAGKTKMARDDGEGNKTEKFVTQVKAAAVNGERTAKNTGTPRLDEFMARMAARFPDDVQETVL